MADEIPIMMLEKLKQDLLRLAGYRQALVMLEPLSQSLRSEYEALRITVYEQLRDTKVAELLTLLSIAGMLEFNYFQASEMVALMADVVIWEEGSQSLQLVNVTGYDEISDPASPLKPALSKRFSTHPEDLPD